MIRVVKPEELDTRRREDALPAEQERKIREILAAVRTEGDSALRRYTEKFDGASLRDLRVTEEEIDAAYEQVPAEWVEALREAAGRIRRYHERQKRQSWVNPEDDGTILGQLIRPLERVGVYVPGGRAAYPSSVLMNAIPARVAGVDEIAMVIAPPRREHPPPHLVAARRVGVGGDWKAGGAQGIAALAYDGSIRRVDKIVGPSNIYVACAKRMVYGTVDIDMIAGPSEIVVIADETADPHTWPPTSSPGGTRPDGQRRADHPFFHVGRTGFPGARQTCEALGSGDRRRILRNIGRSSHGGRRRRWRGQPAGPRASGASGGRSLALGRRCRSCRAVFLGEYSPEPVGDYFALPMGSPTNGTARFFSPLSVDDFLKKTSLIAYSREALRDGPRVIALAKGRGWGPRQWIRVRLDRKKGRTG